MKSAEVNKKRGWFNVSSAFVVPVEKSYWGELGNDIYRLTGLFCETQKP